MERRKTIKKITKEQNGITLVALVITIVILIILAVISITAVFGENGLIKRAEEAKNMTEEATRNEEQSIANAVEYMNEILGGSIPDEPEDNTYVDSVLAEAPKLSEGMTPVKWNGTNWVKTTAEDNKWYDYSKKEWANVVLGDATFKASGSEEILDESKAYSMLVWIPRYAYQITSQYHQSGSTAGNINIVFVDTNNQNKDKSKTYSESYPSYSTGSGMTDYVVHPAFNYGDTEETKTKLAGIWVGKYETSNTNCTTDASTGKASYTGNEIVTIRPNVTSWRSISISNIYTVCTELNKSGNPYGLNSSDSVVDPHLMKNTEWGAVAYLSQNTTYGKGSEVWINNSSDYITGNAGSSVSASSASGVTNAYNTSNGQNASTTGNVTGVYDMSGGAYEYVAAYVNNGHSSLTTYGSNLVNAAARYKDVYQATSTSGSDSQSGNYNLLTPTEKYGDAVYETSSSYSDSTSWYADYSYFPYSNSPFFVRGGYYNDGSFAGFISFNNNSGGSSSYYSFRVVLPVM